MAIVGCLATQLVAQSPARPANSTDPESIRELEQFVTTIALAHIPHAFQDHIDWGSQSERWDGLKVHFDGLRLKTKRRKKMVNHGTWKMYRVSLRDPHKNLAIRLANLHSTRDKKFSFDIHVTAPLLVHGRVAQWVKGVQLFSVSADAVAKVQLAARCEVGFTFDVTEFPPAVSVHPKVTHADVQLVEFQMYRVSDVGGEIAQQLGRGAESIIEKQLVKERPKLVAKLNAELDKNRDKLRISPKDLFRSKWGKLVRQQLAQSR